MLKLEKNKYLIKKKMLKSKKAINSSNNDKKNQLTNLPRLGNSNSI